LFFLLMSFLSINASSQKVVEQLFKTSDKYAPFLGNSSAFIDVIFTLAYDLDKRDSTLNVVFQVNQTNTVSQGGSVAGGVFAGRLAVSGSTYYTLDKKDGLRILGYESFDTLAKYCHSMLEYAKQKFGRNRIVMYSMGNIKLSMEITFVKNTATDFSDFVRKFYISIDDATFKLSQEDFEKFTINTIDVIKSYWDSYNSSKLLPMPLY